MSEYEELISETTQTPPTTQHTVTMETLEDLSKSAEILMRPILHVNQQGTHTFYVIDGDTLLKYTTKL